jgi:uroporphyrinogen-III synthase
VSEQPLAGRRIFVTRGATQAPKLSDSLRALGAIPVEVPVLEIVPPASYEPLDDAIQNLDRYDWLILTSTNTVHALVERIAYLGIVAPASSPQIAAIGSATAEAARDAGMKVSLTPKDYVAESLVDALQDQIAGKRVLLARAAIARDVIPDALRAAGATVDVVDAYRNVLPLEAPAQLQAALVNGLDAATFTSSSSVTHLAEAAEKAGIPFPLTGVPAISIGPITSQTLREAHWPPVAEADPHDIPGLIAAVKAFLSAC